MKTLVFVENDKVISKKVKSTIEAELGEELKVICAYTAAEAYEIIQTIHADIFILDLQLPDVDGLTFAKELRKTHEFTPMMIASSVDDLKVQVEANNKLNIFLYLIKPYAPAEIIPSLTTVLRRLRQPPGNYFRLKKGTKYFKVDVNEVILVEKITGGKQIELHIFDPNKGQTFIEKFPMQSLDKFHNLLNDPRDLIRINQSAFVNPRYIDYYDGLENELHLKYTEKWVMIGKTYRNNIKALFK